MGLNFIVDQLFRWSLKVKKSLTSSKLIRRSQAQWENACCNNIGSLVVPHHTLLNTKVVESATMKPMSTTGGIIFSFSIYRHPVKEKASISDGD
ncbi:MAG: hypothetical protein AAFX87_20375 [Bacteroidota bacterium]